MSDFETVCNAIITGLQDAVPAIANIPDSMVHRYWPASPEFLEARAGERHMAVWTAGEGETVSPMGEGFHELNQVYIVTIWEDAGTEGPRRMADEEANKTWLELHNDIRAWAYTTANETLGGLDRFWYSGTAFHDVPGNVRYMICRFTGRHLAGFV